MLSIGRITVGDTCRGVAAASDADELVGMFGDHDNNVVDPIVPAMETKAEATWWPNQRRAPTRV